MPHFAIPLIVGGIIQLIKVGIDFLTQGKINLASVRSAGGFPSVHSGIAASITTLMFLEYGIQSAEFAIAFCFSFLFWYDAANVRYEAGQHATFLNRLNEEIDRAFNLGEKTVLLKERLGHTAFEVMGGIIVGACLTVTYYVIGPL